MPRYESKSEKNPVTAAERVATRRANWITGGIFTAGAAIGAVAGALLAHAFGGHSEEAARGALIGGSLATIATGKTLGVLIRRSETGNAS